MPPIVADQVHVCNLSQIVYSYDNIEYLSGDTYAGVPLGEYVSFYQQQIGAAFIFGMFFKLIFFDGYGILRLVNAICNLVTVIAIYKIGNQISKKHEINKILLIFLMITFVSLSMLSTFIYGDLPSLTFILFSVYYMMKYTETKKVKNAIIASILAMIAYMIRTNSLIFVIATVIYLFLDILETKSKISKENLIKVLVIFMYVIISIIPSIFVKNYYISKWDLDKDKSCPTINYILMGMEESKRGNGWYIEKIGENTLKEVMVGNKDKVEKDYKEKIENRINYFTNNPKYALEFYTEKAVSMWAENTYSAVQNNYLNIDITNQLAFYQKTMLILICCLSITNLIQNRKDISIDIVFLILIFMGGFAFHMLWEAKSRYIIPYIIVLIPCASINLKKKLKKLVKNTVQNSKV